MENYKISNIMNERGFILFTAIWLTFLLTVMGSAAVVSTRINLKISSNYKTMVQELYRQEGIAERAIWGLKTGEDRDLDGIEDFQQLHGNNDPVSFIDDNYIVLIERHPTDSHLVIISVGRIQIIINNFPGGGESCQNNNQCTPERVAWKEI